MEDKPVNRVMPNEMSVKELVSELLDNPPDDLFRQMVEYELMSRCQEEIDRPEFEVFMKKLGDKKILYFPRFPWKQEL